MTTTAERICPDCGRPVNEFTVRIGTHKDCVPVVGGEHHGDEGHREGDAGAGGPFASTWRMYMRKGWAPLPLPAGEKSPPPPGLTGAGGRRMLADEAERAAEDRPGRNVGLWPHGEWVGIDADSYVKDGVDKRGVENLEELRVRSGLPPLPATYRSSARTGLTGIRFFRVPPGWEPAGTGPCADVEWIRRGHRYAVVFPSTNPEAAGATYQWYDQKGRVCAEPPAVWDLPALPAEWIDHFSPTKAQAEARASRAQAREAGEAGMVGREAWAASVGGTDEPPCRKVIRVGERYVRALEEGDEGSRHDLTLRGLHALARAATEGHQGAAGAVEAVVEAYTAAVGPARAHAGEHTPGGTEVDRMFTAHVFEPRPDGLDDPCADDLWKDGPVTDETGEGGEYIDGDLERGATASVPMGRQFVARRLAGRYRHAPGLGWLHYRAGCWYPMGADGEARLTDQAMRFGAQVAKKAVDTGADSETIKALLRYREAGRARELVIVARTDVRVHTSAGDLDAHPHLLCVANGVVDLRTGELLAHDPGLLLTRTTGVRYVAGAEHPLWARALECLPPALRDYLQARLGQGITGEPPDDDALAILHGGGSNGKSTVLDGVAAALGGHCTVVSKRVLLAGAGEHPTELMALRGARLAFLEELTETGGGRINVGRLKDVAGTGQMTARLIRQDSVTWTVSHTLIATTNTLPTVVETDDGTWRRLLVIPFRAHYLKPHEPDEPGGLRGDPDVRHAVRHATGALAEAILAWVVAGAVDWYKAGRRLPDPPANVVEAVGAWRTTSDVLLAFAEERLAPSPEGFVPTTNVLRWANAYLESMGHQHLAARTFVPRFLATAWARRYHITDDRRRLDGRQVRGFAGLIGQAEPPPAVEDLL
ncbi:phage/plasmid primase, P4 family [Isoptericola sp. NPDC019693]|uniref:phage/plasmid primase, P4 family n=1 Tax=Isoptericola sp. NPDC019693 TaxID=3364009 RepID=UPI0037AFD00D